MNGSRIACSLEVLGQRRVGARNLLRRHRLGLDPHAAARRVRRLDRVHADAVPDSQLDAVAVQHLEPRELVAIDLRRQLAPPAPSAARTPARRPDARPPATPGSSQRGTERPPSLVLGIDEEQRHQRWPPRWRTSPRITTSGSSGSGANGPSEPLPTASDDDLLAAARPPLPHARRLAVAIEPLLARLPRVRAPRRGRPQLARSSPSSANVIPNDDGTS